MTDYNTQGTPVRYHMLKAIDESFRHSLIKFLAAEDAPTREMELGTAAHAILFNTDRVVFAPMKRDERHEKYQKFLSDNAGALIVTQTDYDEANRIAEAVRSNPEANQFLTGSPDILIEKTVLMPWHGEPYDQRVCRMTPDAVHPDNFIVDFKTSKNASPSKWPFLMRDYDIAGQLAWYSAAYPEAQAFYTVVIEKGTNIVQVYRVDDKSMESAWNRNIARLAKLNYAESNNYWPGYSAGEILVVEQAAAWPSAAE